MSSKVSRDIREALAIVEGKSRLFEEDTHTPADGDTDGEDMIECPHCFDTFVITENNLFEDEDGDIVSICPLCENVVVVPNDEDDEGGDGLDKDEGIFECPYCENEFEETQTTLTEDEDGYLIAQCPFCDESFSFIDESDMIEIAAGPGRRVGALAGRAREARAALSTKGGKKKAAKYGAAAAGALAASYGLKKGVQALKKRRAAKKRRTEDVGLTEVKKRVVRHGKRVTIDVSMKKKRMSAKQKAALKKARRKAHTGKAKRSRAKSMRMAEAMLETFNADPKGYHALMEDTDVELSEKRVRGGVVVKAPTEREHVVAARAFKHSAKRRAALKKAQRASRRGGAARKRAKSMRKGKAAGLYR